MNDYVCGGKILQLAVAVMGIGNVDKTHF